MKNILEQVKIVEKFNENMRGVFTLSDLKAMFSFKNPILFYRCLANLEKAKVINRVSRGLYVADNFDPNALSQKICEQSYISFETVLAKNLIIGTLPKNQIKAIKIGKKREYKYQNLTITHYGVCEHLYFGYETIDGINYATKEKALLDTLYFYSKALKFYFDIYSDINLGCIDKNIVYKYLSNYKNPKFVKFVKKYLEEN